MRGSEAAPATFEQSVSHEIGDHVEDDNDCDYQSYHEEDEASPEEQDRRQRALDELHAWEDARDIFGPQDYFSDDEFPSLVGLKSKTAAHVFADCVFFAGGSASHVFAGCVLILTTCTFFLEPEYFSEALFPPNTCDVSILHGKYITCLCGLRCMFFFASGSASHGLRCDLYKWECFACLCGLRFDSCNW